VENDFNIEETIVKFHSKEMVIGHQAGISKSSDIKIFHCSKPTLSAILVIILFGCFSHGFSPSGLSHEDPLIKQLAWPCLYSPFIF
jgi:hypothetical protein